RAADLCRDADGRPCFFGHPDCFDGFSIRKAEQVAARAVSGIVMAFNPRQPERVLVGEARAQRLGQICNLIEGGRSLAIERIVELPRAKTRLAGPEEGFQIGQIEPDQAVVVGHALACLLSSCLTDFSGGCGARAKMESLWAGSSVGR